MTKHDTPNQTIVGKLGNSAHNTAAYGSHKAQAEADRTNAEMHKEQMKGHITGNSSVLDRVEGAVKYTGNKMSEAGHRISASHNKHSI